MQHCRYRFILNLPKQIRSDICEQLLNLTQIMSEIDARRLLFVKTVSYGPTMSHKANHYIKTTFFFIESHPNSTRLYLRRLKYPPKVWINTSSLMTGLTVVYSLQNSFGKTIARSTLKSIMSVGVLDLHNYWWINVKTTLIYIDFMSELCSLIETNSLLCPLRPPHSNCCVDFYRK